MEHSKSQIRRCAIFTRKSSEEGLEQDFNSLHAQREAYEAFIRSQTGVILAPGETAYDDGGLSGGTIERSGFELPVPICEQSDDSINDADLC